MVGADPRAWEAAGFAVIDASAMAGEVALGFTDGRGGGILGWTLAGIDDRELDGLPAASTEDRDPLAVGQPAHLNGTVKIDHLVVFTPELERTTEAFEAAGIECRRVREVELDGGALRQGFFRLGEVILEVVEHAKVEPGPARFWGITFAVEDLDACADLLGEKLGSIRDAVQPGRRIATVRKEAGLGLPVALISAE